MKKILLVLSLLLLASCGDDDVSTTGESTSGSTAEWFGTTDPKTGIHLRCVWRLHNGYDEAGAGMWCMETESIGTP